jgi:hypothetical protein
MSETSSEGGVLEFGDVKVSDAEKATLAEISSALGVAGRGKWLLSNPCTSGPSLASRTCRKLGGITVGNRTTVKLVSTVLLGASLMLMGSAGRSSAWVASPAALLTAAASTDVDIVVRRGGGGVHRGTTVARGGTVAHRGTTVARGGTVAHRGTTVARGGTVAHRGTTVARGGTVAHRGATVRRGGTVAHRGTTVVRGSGAVGVRGGAWGVRPWVRRPYFGTVVGGVALGTIIAASTVPVAPQPGLCWYWTNSSQTRGYWDYCQ